MSYTTDNYEFTVPEIDDIPDISVLSQNWDNLDEILNGIDIRNKIETVSSTVDLNGYTEQGVYRFTSSHTPTNVPSGCTEGWLFVVPWNNAYEAVQFWLNYADRKVYIRKRVYPTWGEWNGLTTSAELSDIYNQLHRAIESNTALIVALQAAIGSPLVASSAESMTDQAKIYVYTGTTTSSLTNGHWYYYDNGWTDGGVYNSVALETDKTLTIPNMAPDSEVVGGEITDLKSALSDVRSNDSADAFLFAQSGISKNLFNPKTIIENTAVRTTNGTLYANTGSAVSDFIPVKAGKKYSIFKISSGTVALAVANRVVAYDKNGGFKSSIGEINSNNKTRTIPSDGTAYVRIMYTMASYPGAESLMFIEVEDETVPDTFSVYGETDFRISDYAKENEIAGINTQIQNIENEIDSITDVFDLDLNTLTGTLITEKFLESNGSIADIASYQLLKVSVTPNVDYYITAQAYNGKAYYVFHDSSEQIVGTFVTAPSSSTITNYKVTAPQGAAYIYVVSSINSNVQAVKTLIRYILPETVHVWSGKKWACVGDSLTQVNEATTKHYYEYITDITGITVSNMGVGGTGYVRGYNNNNAFYQRISNVPTDADIVTIFGSGNDCNIEAMSKFDGMTWAQALGTYTDATTDTICGCVNATLDAYFAVMTTAPIGIIAPSPWKSYPTTKLTNNRFADYTEALRQIAVYRGVPFLDLYHGSNLRPENEANCDACFYNSASFDGNGDGVHPNALGHQILAPKIYEFVKTLLLN